MWYTGKRMTKDEIRVQNTEIIDGPYFGKKSDSCLTLTGKKTILTKWIKQAEEYYEIVSKTYKRPRNERYYLGDFIYSWVVLNAKLDVEVLKEMRKKLDECQANDTYSGDCPNEGM